MSRRDLLPALTALLALLALLLAGCSAHDAYSIGRPCSVTEPCGPDAECDQSRLICVPINGGTGNLDLGSLPQYDGNSGPPDVSEIEADRGVDVTSGDSFIKPDAGCPSSAPTQCGNICVNIDSDPGHCGGCGKACKANQRCESKTCVCRSGYENCDGNADNGCEAKLSSDPNNCVGCGNKCGGGATCQNGCQCNSGRQNCDNNFSNGCECTSGCSGTSCKSTGCDPNTAFACGSSKTAYCDNGACRTCTAGSYNCNGTGGCECTRPCAGNSCGCDPAAVGWCGGTDKYCNTSTNFCSACATDKSNCNRQYGCECSNGCSGSSCAPPPCSISTRWSCGTSTSRYCETASKTCKSCASGTYNCNGVVGCECGPNTICSGTSCRCRAGYCNNDSSYANGCEGRLGTNTHCSACGSSCSASCANGCRQICSGNKCVCPAPPCPF